MFGITRKRLAVLLSAFMITLLLVLILGTVALARGPIANMVHVGGPDACEEFDLDPGCDANFSLNAILFVDGSVSGQYTDQFGDGLGGFHGGFHAVIDCLSVDENEAWVSGVITQGNLGDFDLADFFVATRVVDNGASANDPADQISLSIITEEVVFSCNDQPEFDLFDMPQGQVIVN